MTQVTKSGNGSFKFAGKTYKIKSSSETVTFNLNDAGEVVSVEGLEGIIAANFSTALIVNGDTVQVQGDSNYLVSVTASANGVSDIGGVNGDSVTIVSAGNANKISTSSSGTFIIADNTFNVKGDKNGVTFNISSGSVTGVNGLDGTIYADFSNGFSINDNPVTISGSVSIVASTSKGITDIKTEDTAVTVSGAGGSAKFTAANDGSFTFGNSSFEVLEAGGATFTLDSLGAVTGVTSLKGSLAFTSNGAPFSVNNNSLTIGSNDAVTVSANSKGSITGVFGLDTYIDGLPAFAAVTATDKNISVNGYAFSVDEGAATSYILTLDSNAVPTQLSDLSSGVVVYNAPNMQLVTGGNGTFNFGGRAFTVTGADSGSFFTTDENSNVTAIDELGGAVAFQGDATLKINNYSFELDKLISTGSPVTLYSGSGGIYNIYGLESGDSISGDLYGAVISMPAAPVSAVLNINSNNFTLYGDSDGALFIPYQNFSAVKFLSANSSLAVPAGSYTFYNDDSDSYSFTFASPATVLVDNDRVIYTADSSNFNLKSDSSINDIINAVALQPNNFFHLDNPYNFLRKKDFSKICRIYIYDLKAIAFTNPLIKSLLLFKRQKEFRFTAEKKYPSCHRDIFFCSYKFCGLGL